VKRGRTGHPGGTYGRGSHEAAQFSEGRHRLVRIADTQKVVIRKSDVPSGEAKNFVYRNAPAVLINRPDKGFIVLSRTCTHLGCLVEYHHAQLLLICPCHAGTYDLEGNVLSGPPPKPLTAIPFRIEGENIVIG
jgi:Rieske Fe-S protein